MLNESQLALLKADIEADPLFAGWWAEEISAEYNKPASPEFVVWRTSVTWDEIMLNGMDWARVDNLSVGKARIWDWMFQNSGNAMNPSKPNIRAGIDATWVGTAADLAVRASAACRRARPNPPKPTSPPEAKMPIISKTRVRVLGPDVEFDRMAFRASLNL